MHSDPLAGQGWGTLEAPAHWRAIDFVSDLHLQAAEPRTAQAWHDYLARTDCDALFILGDLFEVWVGDDALTQDQDSPEGAFWRGCAQALRNSSARQPVYLLHGNRDFLLGLDFAAHTGVQLLQDPTLLSWSGPRLLLTHGDAWCLADNDYLDFRAQVRSPAWQQAFLARPLAERLEVARQLRQQSEARKALPDQLWADVDLPTALRWLHDARAQILVHGHTHRPADQPLGNGHRRMVLSDWDADAQPPRAQVLRLLTNGTWERRPLPA